MSERDQQQNADALSVFRLPLLVKACTGVGFKGAWICFRGESVSSQLRVQLGRVSVTATDSAEFRNQASAQNLRERMSEQLFSAGSVFGFHENTPDEVPSLVGRVRGQERVSGLGGDLEYGRHRLELGPRRLLRQHLHHRAAEAPGRNICFESNQ